MQNTRRTHVKSQLIPKFGIWSNNLKCFYRPCEKNEKRLCSAVKRQLRVFIGDGNFKMRTEDRRTKDYLAPELYE